MKILVTGADGFIGSHLVEALKNKGHEVKALCLYNSFNHWGWLENIKDKHNIEIVSGDIRDSFLMRKIMKGCDAIYNLAALIAIPYSYEAPQSYIETNILGTLNLLQTALDLKISRFIHTSTSEVYGTAKFVPITEEHPLSAQSPYAASKIGADQLVLSFYRSFGLPAVILRPFNTYGPRQSARAVIPTLITQLYSNQNKIKLGNITPTRDFNFVRDTVSGFIAALKAPHIEGKVINLCSQFEISIKQTANLISEIMQKPLFIESDEQRIRPTQSEVERLFGCNEKAKKMLDWQPEFAGISGFKEGLKITVDWFSQKENRALYKSDLYNL